MARLVGSGGVSWMVMDRGVAVELVYMGIVSQGNYADWETEAEVTFGHTVLRRFF